MGKPRLNSTKQSINPDKVDTYMDTSNNSKLNDWLKRAEKEKTKVIKELKSSLDESLLIERKNNIDLTITDESLIFSSIALYPPEQLIQFHNDITKILIALDVIDPQTGETKTFPVVLDKKLNKINVDSDKLLNFKVSELIKEVGEGITKLCYLLLLKLTYLRIYLCMDINSRDSLYIALAHILEKKQINLDQLIDSIDRQSKITASLQSKKQGNEVNSNEFKSELYFQAIKVFKTNDIKEMLIKAMYSNKLSKIAINTDKIAINEYTKYLKNMLPIEDFIPLIISEAKIEELIDIHRISDWIKTIEIDRDKKIAELYFLNEYSLKEIADKLNVSKSTIQYRVEKLKKSKPF